MKERPILFNAEMVKAILYGRKTQTRRVVKPMFGPRIDIEDIGEGKWQISGDAPTNYGGEVQMNDWSTVINSPFGTIGDRLWVRETFGCLGRYPKDGPSPVGEEASTVYHATDKVVPHIIRWRPSIHMPRWASRITLEITGVRVERLQEISDFDAFQEGAPSAAGTITGPYCMSFKQGFHNLLQSIYGNWDANPWVWVYEFRKV